MVFFLPGTVDIAVILLAARHRELFWLFPILATAGSLTGAYVTFSIGARIGQKGLSHWVSERKLRPIEKRIKDKGAVALALPGLMPPPFPLTPFILVCGALKVRRLTFFLTLAGARLLRFGTGAGLSLVYGPGILRIFESPLFNAIIVALFLIAIAGTAYSIVRIVRSTRKARPRLSRLSG